MKSKTKLYAMHLGGNLFDVTEAINRLGWADNVLHMESSGSNSIVVLRFPIGFDPDRKRKADARKVVRDRNVK